MYKIFKVKNNGVAMSHKFYVLKIEKKNKI